MKTKRGLLLFLAIVIASLLTQGCGTTSTDPDQWGVLFSGGITEEKRFEGIVDPGATNTVIGAGSHSYSYPVLSLRTYFISGKEDVGDTSGSDAINTPVRGGARANFEGDISFWICSGATDLEWLQKNWGPGEGQLGDASLTKEVIDALNSQGKVEVKNLDNFGNASEEDQVTVLTTSCLLSFQRAIGFKTKAYESPEQWLKMLNEYLRPALEKAVVGQSSSYTVDQLIGNKDDRAAFNKDVGVALEAQLRAKMGGRLYFRVTSADFSTFTPVGKGVQEAYDEKANVAVALETEKQRGALRDEQIANAKKLAAGGFFTPEQVVCLLAIEAAREAGSAPPVCLAGSIAGVVVGANTSPSTTAGG